MIQTSETSYRKHKIINLHQHTFLKSEILFFKKMKKEEKNIKNGILFRMFSQTVAIAMSLSFFLMIALEM